MRITSLHIENFRSIKLLDLDLTDTTVLIGANNAGKTAILDALRIALMRRWGQRGTGFTEYDIYREKDSDDPKTSPGVVIDVRAEEATQGEWPEEVHQALDNIVQLDPASGRGSITLRVSCCWSEADAAYQPEWVFLNSARQVLKGASARRMNLERFWQYVPMFYLEALRDVQDEFSPKSQFWGRLLKATQIPAALEKKVQRVLDLLNTKLSRADPRLARIAATLSGATRVASRDRIGGVDVRVVPLKSWDLLSKAEIILRNEPDWPWLPLQRHGQGVQSLSVIFLFQAFVELLLPEFYAPESTPVLALEEPETHLHPQAARTLWVHVNALPGQKLVTTHSPFFVQHVPIRDLRLVRLTPTGTEVRWIPASFTAQIPHTDELDAVVAQSSGLLAYDRAATTLIIYGRLDEALYRKLLTCYGAHANQSQIHSILRDLRYRALGYMPDDELRALETFARRIRGEIFFAQRWLIVEGQGEYLLVHALARALGYDLDEHGVSVIDAMNNGKPVAFVVLARALGIPWTCVFDGDPAGTGYVQAIVDRDFEPQAVAERCRILAAGTLEQQLLADGLEAVLRAVLVDIGEPTAASIDRPGLERLLGKNKIRYAAELASRISIDATLVPRMPQMFRDAIAQLNGLG